MLNKEFFSPFIPLQLFVSQFVVVLFSFFVFIHRAYVLSDEALCKWRIGYAYASMWCGLKMFAQAILFFLCDFVTTGIFLHMDFTNTTTYLFGCFLVFCPVLPYFFLRFFIAVYRYVCMCCSSRCHRIHLILFSFFALVFCPSIIRYVYWIYLLRLCGAFERTYAPGYGMLRGVWAYSLLENSLQMPIKITVVAHKIVETKSYILNNVHIWRMANDWRRQY